MSEPYALFLKLLFDLVKVAGNETKRLVARVTGKRILILGPKGAGKSSFAHYLVNHRLRPPELPYKPTKSLTRQGRFPVPIGDSETLELRVKEAMEVPGSWDANLQAWIMSDSVPDILVIVLDLTTSDASRRHWLEQLTEKLAVSFSEHPKIAEKIETTLILLNKRDCFETSSADLEQQAGVIREKIEANLESTPYNLDRIMILSTVLVDHPEWGDKLASTAVSLIARSVYEQEGGLR